MKEVKIEVAILFIVLLGWISAVAIRDIYFTNNTSSPVEEMYHRQLVVTLDSILDARFGAGCCEEVIDSGDVTINHSRFGNMLVPME